MKKLIFCLYEFYIYIILNRFIFRWIPFWYIRRLFLLPFVKGIGYHSQIDMDCFFFEPRKLKIGEHSHINRNVTLDSRGGIEIGERCSISLCCKTNNYFRLCAYRCWCYYSCRCQYWPWSRNSSRCRCNKRCVQLRHCRWCSGKNNRIQGKRS